MTKYAYYDTRDGRLLYIKEQTEEENRIESERYSTTDSTTIIPIIANNLENGLTQLLNFDAEANKWNEDWDIYQANAKGNIRVFALRNNLPVIIDNYNGKLSQVPNIDAGTASPFPDHEKHKINTLSHITLFTIHASHEIAIRRLNYTKSTYRDYLDFMQRYMEAYEQHEGGTTFQKLRAALEYIRYFIRSLTNFPETDDANDIRRVHKDELAKSLSDSQNTMKRAGGLRIVGAIQDLTSTALDLGIYDTLQQASFILSRTESHFTSRTSEQKLKHPAIRGNTQTGQKSFRDYDKEISIEASRRVAMAHRKPFVNGRGETSYFFPFDYDNIPKEVIEELKREYDVVKLERQQASGTASGYKVLIDDMLDMPENEESVEAEVEAILDREYS